MLGGRDAPVGVEVAVALVDVLGRARHVGDQVSWPADGPYRRKFVYRVRLMRCAVRPFACVRWADPAVNLVANEAARPARGGMASEDHGHIVPGKDSREGPVIGSEKRTSALAAGRGRRASADTYHPNVSITKMPKAAAKGVSLTISDAILRVLGANTSSCSTLHVFLWCFACEMRQLW